MIIATFLNLMYEGQKGALLCFDLTDKGSFDEATTLWIDEIRRNAPDDIVVALVSLDIFVVM